MKPKDSDTFIDIGVSITRLLLIASGQGTAASLIGEGAGLLRNLRSGGQRAVSAEKIAADVFNRLPGEYQDISEADWQVAATHVAPLIDRLSEKDRLAAGYDWTALRPVLRDLGSEERRCTLADESARQAFDWVLDVACQHITDCFTKEEALASILRGINETESGVRQLLDRPAGASKTQDVVNDHIKVLRDLAPDRLEDRESEMADLKAFVHSSDDVWYAMEADMVSGKTAVMVSFALNSPDDVHMVSFFIRRIGGDGNDRGSFAFVMSAQLAKILGHEYTEPVRDPAQHTEFRQLLRRAAAACRSETTPRPLVLLIDGIDEDSYFENPDGADAKSILSLLPRRLPEGVKIITASRPNPRLPEDVLCDADRRIVSLKPSPIAEKSINRKDIAEFFKSDVAVDIGAFLAACGGVLTVEDLRRLLTIHGYQRILTWDVRGHVDRSPGRILTPINVGFGGQEVLAYRLGHDVVTRAVIRELDPDSFGEGDEPEDERWWAPIREKTLAPYRAIIRDWVKKCANGGWGDSTPSYVLSGACFDLMFNDKRDDGSSVRVVLDRGRYNEMRRRSGRRSNVLRMIDRECFTILDMNRGELPEDATTSIFEIAESRKLLVQASTYIPGLPKLYVSHLNITPEAAMDMIMAVDDPKDRLSALGETMKAAIESGHGCAFLTLLPAMFSSLVIYRDLRDEILHLLVDIIVSIGDAANKSKFGSNESADPENQINEVIVLVEMIESLLRSLSSFEKIDDLDNDARTIASLLVVAEDIAERIEEPWERAKALAEVACTLARAAQTDIVLNVIEKIDNLRIGARLTLDCECVESLLKVAGALANTGQTDVTIKISERIDNFEKYAEILAGVAGALVWEGQTDRAVDIAERIKHPRFRAEALAGVAGALAQTGQTDMARRVAENVVNVAGRIGRPDEHAAVLGEMAGALARAGQTDMALAVVGRIEDSWVRAGVFTIVVSVLVRAGQTDRAADIAEQIEDPEEHVWALMEMKVADMLTGADRTDGVLDIARQIKDPEEHASALVKIAGALVWAGFIDKAFKIIETMDDIYFRSRAQSAVIKALVRKGSFNEAVDMLHAAIAEVEGFVSRQDAADYCAVLAATCLDAADLVDAGTTTHEQWLGLARSALARSWLYGAPVWNCFDVLLRVAPDLAMRLVEERLLANPEPRPGSDPGGPGGGAASSR